ncbi:ChaN family lipoprotein [Vannielia sp. SX4]|uniref:ChaN family lipoprotein n=1 Tax=Vannielia sp. SX4 TaxID=3463852 RepID=UPI004058727C
MSTAGAGWFHPGSAAPVPHAEAIAELAGAPAVLLGETHDRADIHRWQLHVAAGLLAHRPIVMGFEMFPARLDPVLAEWVGGGLSEEAFLAKAEWGEVWGFPPDLYMPLFRFCREAGVPMLGLNCRRGLVREVGAGGWEAVAEADREGLTPARPSPMPYRRYIFDLAGGGPPGRKATGPEDPAFDRFLRAQEVWDRAFATRIVAALRVPEPPLVVGIIGQGHLLWGGGVPWQMSDLGVDGVAVACRAPDEAPAAKGMADFLYTLPEIDS